MPSVIPAVIGGSALVGSGISASAAQSAASTQAAAERSAAATQLQMFDQTQANLAPYNKAGQAATANIENMAPFNFNPTMAQIAGTPGYKFNLQQGLNATQNSLASQGLGASGQAEAGAAQYAQGLAGTQYQNLFNNALSTYGTNLGRQQNLANLGENAAAMTGQYATQTGANIGATAVGAANAEAAGQVGTANAITGGLSGASNAYLLNSFLNNGGGGIFGTGGSGASSFSGVPISGLVSAEAGG